MVNVVIDTNLIIAAYYNKRSDSAKVLDLARNEEINVIWSEPLLREAKKILDNIKASNEYRRSLLSIFKESHKVLKPENADGVVPDDPSDNKLIGCALKGASYIVSSDHHLLDLKEYKGIKMVKPGEFLRELKDFS
ncbi:putative toxin-antitoxin system toxin component, PIN family [Patescibacteria group bacterium]